MATRSVPERTVWALERLAAVPGDRLLEIGCGRGTAVALLCERLVDGSILAIDRSATMIRMAAERNAAQVAAGRVEFRVADFRAAGLAGERFDKVFAVNVNLFWVRPAGEELALARRLLVPGGVLCLCYEVPTVSRAAAVADRLARTLAEHGFTPEFTTGSTRRNALLSVLARPAG